MLKMFKGLCSLFFVGAVSLFLPYVASAGSFKVVPIRLLIDGGQKSAAFTVTNDAEEKVTIQIGVKAWSQDENGKDIYQPSDDLIVFPKIFTIGKKNGEQVVRVAFRKQVAPLSPKEISYRFFFEELPVKKPGETALMFALNLSIPAFINPIKAIEGVALENLKFSDGALQVRVKNNGSSHKMVGKMKVSGLGPTGASLFTKADNGWYVLSGASRLFPIPVPKKNCLEIKKLTVSVEVGKTTLTGETAVDSAQCVEKEKQPEGPKTTPITPSEEGSDEKKKEEQ